MTKNVESKTILDGVIPDLEIKRLISENYIIGASENYIQPATLDLQPDLNTLHELKEIIFPRKSESLDDLISQLRKTGIAKELNSITLDVGKKYLVRLQEKMKRMPYFVRSSTKSSIGRIFNHCRLLASWHEGVDNFPEGYSGNLWLLITPKLFNITLSETEQLNQLRFFSGDARLTTAELRRYLAKNTSLVSLPDDLFTQPIAIAGNGIAEVPLSADLSGVCYRTRRTEEPINLSGRDMMSATYYEVIDPDSMQNGILLEQGYGYLIGSLERFQVPQDLVVEVVISDRYGEIKLHFAGFVDNGFGLGTGNSITLEIVCYEPGVRIRHGQQIGNARFEWLARPSEKIYNGNYTIQARGAKLPKYVK